MAFSDEEKSQIKYFMEYPDWVSLASSIQLGYPAASQPLFILEDAFKRLTPGGEWSAKRCLCQCMAIENQMIEARARYAATQLGELHTNPNEQNQLRKDLLYWVTRLSDCFGAYTNPLSNAMYKSIMAMGSTQGRVG